MNEYTYDREAKRITAPDGSKLTIKDTLSHLNQMFSALDYMYIIWGSLHDSMSAMDSVFLGASQPEVEIEDTDYIEEGEEVKEKEHKDKEIEEPTLTTLPSPTNEEEE